MEGYCSVKVNCYKIQAKNISFKNEKMEEEWLSN